MDLGNVWMYFAVNSEEIETAIKENEEGYDDLMGKVLKVNRSKNKLSLYANTGFGRNDVAL